MKILVLGTNQTKIAAGLSVANHSNKGRPFRLALPRADFCYNSAERELKGPLNVCLFLSLAIFNSFSNGFYICTPLGPQFLHVNPT